ncbi:TPA: hypothetical protein QCW55_005629 [Bacillus cereus]|nr:hypothetical protein [Bacillus cereus]
MTEVKNEQKKREKVQLKGELQDVEAIYGLIEKNNMTHKEFLKLTLTAVSKELESKGAGELNFASDIEEINQHMLRVYGVLGNMTDRAKAAMDSKTEHLEQQVKEKEEAFQKLQVETETKVNEYDEKAKEQQEEIKALKEQLKEEREGSKKLKQQLKDSKEENEKLEEENSQLLKSVTVVREVMDKLGKENKELTAAVEKNKKTVEENKELKKEKEQLTKQTIEQTKEIEKLKDDSKKDVEMAKLLVKTEYMNQINELNQKHFEQMNQLRNEQTKEKTEEKKEELVKEEVKPVEEKKEELVKEKEEKTVVAKQKEATGTGNKRVKNQKPVQKEESKNE